MSLTQSLLDIIFPPVCLACQKYPGENRFLCGKCAEKLSFRPGFLCSVCRRPISIHDCHSDSPFVLAAPLEYANPVVRELVSALKYRRARDAARPLAGILAAYLEETCRETDFSNHCLIPIPLHRLKEKERGFSQARMIAEELKKISEKFRPVPILDNILVKNRATASQTKQENYRAREENVRGSFGIGNPDLISGRNILLLDDVFTSGATMREAARVLTLAGANKIIALAIARA